MDASVRRLADSDRRAQQALYAIDGFIGEGAFGVVMKARRIQQQQAEDAAAVAASSGGVPDSENAGSSYAAGVSASAPPAAAAAAAASTPPTYVAIKQMMNSREGQGIPQDAYREIKILKELRHPHIVSLERIFTRPAKPGEVDLVYEYAEHDLADIIKVNRTRLQGMPPIEPDPRFVKSVMYQLLAGLAFLHKNWTMHRDVKPANVLITGADQGDAAGKVKIADFGLARIFQSPLRKLSDDGEVVTIWYRAPELLLGSKHYTRGVDCFAAGCIFYELLACNPLFPGTESKGGQKVFQENQMRTVFKVLGKPTVEQWKGIVDTPHYQYIKGWPQKDYPPTLDARLPQRLSPHARSLLLGLLAYDPAVRLTADAALAHPYFREEPRPDRNVFRDQRNNMLPYPTRPHRSRHEAKRNRGADAAAAGGPQPAHHHQQPLDPRDAANAAAAAIAAAAVAGANGGVAAASSSGYPALSAASLAHLPPGAASAAAAATAEMPSMAALRTHQQMLEQRFQHISNLPGAQPHPLYAMEPAPNEPPHKMRRL